jgi:hypothetical protein
VRCVDIHERRVANVGEVRAHWQAFVNTFLKPLGFVRGWGFFDERMKIGVSQTDSRPNRLCY